MPIDVFQVENLFGSNSSYKVPNSLPEEFLDKRLGERSVPHHYNLLGGKITLRGGHWNGAKYENVYYFLQREVPLTMDVKDPRRQKWLYNMIRDHGANSVLTRVVHVKGDITTWNIDGDLEDHLNRTVQVLADPAELVRLPFEEGTFSGDEKLVIKKIEKTFKTKVVTKEVIDQIKKRLQFISTYYKTAEYLYTKRKDVFILGSVEASHLLNSWKEKVKKIVNDSLDEVAKPNKYFLGKVVAVNQSPLLAHYVVTAASDSIGQKDSTVNLEELDLSNVTDIVRINWNDLRRSPALTPLNEETAVFETESGRFDEMPYNNVFKLARRAYLPINQFQGTGKGGVSLSNGISGIDGQRINYKLNSQEEKQAYLYGIDKIDFILSYYVGRVDKTSLAITSTNPIAIFKYLINRPALKQRFFGSGADPQSSVYNLRGKQTTHPLTQRYEGMVEMDPSKYDPIYPTSTFYGMNFKTWPHFPINVTSDKEKFLGEKLKEETPGYGFLMGQHIKSPRFWRRIEYLGKTPIKEIEWSSGIDKFKFLKDYKEKKGEGGSEVDGRTIAGLCGDSTFSKIFLDFDQLNFMHFLPAYETDKIFETTENKCYYEDIYGIRDFLHGKYECEVVRILNNNRLKVNGNPIINPWSNLYYKNFRDERERKLNELILKNTLELPVELRKGDYLISSLEYRGDLYGTNYGGTTDEYYQYINKEDGITQSLNLLEDFMTNTENKQDVDLIKSLNFSSENDKKLIICSDLDGSVVFRELSYFDYDHQLSSDDSQLITSVDGEVSRKIRYYILRGSPQVSMQLETNEQVNLLLAHYYKAGTDSVVNTEDPKNVRGDGVTDEMLDSPAGNLFDFVGTNGYVYIRGGKAHFILKDPEGAAVKGIIKDAQRLKKPTTEKEKKESIYSHLGSLPLSAKINQICTIGYKTHANPLLTRFHFNEKDHVLEPLVSVRGIETKDDLTTMDYFVFKLETPYDYIDEKIEIPKETARQREVADQISLDVLRLQMLRADEDYVLAKERISLGKRIATATAGRQNGDLEMEAAYRNVDIAFSAIGLAGSLIRKGVPLATLPMRNKLKVLASDIKDKSKVVNKLKSTLKENETLPDDTPEVIALSQAESLYGATAKRYKGKFKFASAITGVERFFGLGGKGAGFMEPIRGIVDNSMGFTHQRPELARRIEEDKAFSFQEIALNSHAIDLIHTRKKEDVLYTMNSLTNRWRKERVTSTMVSKKGLESLSLTDLYMTVKYPSKEQLHYIEEYRNEFGVDCDIPNKVITLKSGMAENIIRMRNIDDEGISGITDLFDRSYLHARLAAGIKIVKTSKSFKSFNFFDPNLIVPNVSKSEDYEKEIKELRDQIDELATEAQREKKQDHKTILYLLDKLDKDKNDVSKLEGDLQELRQLLTKINETPQNYPESFKRLLENVIAGVLSRLEDEKREANIRQEFEDREKGLRDAKTEIEEKLRSKEEELSKKTEEATKFRKEADSERSKNQLSIFMLGEERKKREECIKDKDRAEKERDEAIKSRDSAIKRSEQVSKRVQTLTQSLADKNNEIQNKARQIENLKNVRTTLTNEKKALNEENERNRTDLSQAQAKVNQLQASYDETSRRLKDAQSELEKARQASGEAERDSQDKGAEIKNLQRKVQELTDESEKLKSDLSTSRRQASSLASTVSTLNKDKKEKEDKIAELEVKLEEGKTSVEAAGRQREAIQKSYEDAVKAEQEAKNQLSTSVQQLSKAEADLKKCNEDLKKARGVNRNLLNRLAAKKKEEGRPLQYGDLCDFLNAFKGVNYDYNEMGKIILAAPSYGLNSSELNLYLGTLEYIDQILEMIKEFEEDNVTFLFNQSDESAREEMLKPEFQERVKKIRGVITLIFLKALGRRFTDEEGGYVYQVKELQKMFEDRILDADIKLVKQTNKTGIFDIKYPETMKSFEMHSFSNLETKKMLKNRYGDVSGDFDNSIGNSNVYYDIYDGYVGGEIGRIFFAAYKRGQEAYHENNMHNLHKKVSVDDLFNIYYNDTSNYLKKGLGYQGRSGRQLYIGFILLHIIRTIKQRIATGTKDQLYWIHMMLAGRKGPGTLPPKEEFVMSRIFDSYETFTHLTFYNVDEIMNLYTIVDEGPNPLTDEGIQLHSIACGVEDSREGEADSEQRGREQRRQESVKKRRRGGT